jgi:hypothetical protein
MNHISWDGIAARLLFCLFIVFATYNPSGRSYWHWLWAGEAGFWTRLAVGLVLLLTHLALFFTRRGVLGWKGLALVTVTFVALMLAAGEIGLAQLSGSWSGTAPLVLVSLLYTFGLSWSLVHHRASGITHVDPVK